MGPIVLSVADVRHSLPTQSKKTGSFYLVLEPSKPRSATAYANYELAPGTIDITHTHVPGPFRGKGLARVLCDAVYNYAEVNNLKVVPSCSYVRQTYLPARIAAEKAAALAQEKKDKEAAAAKDASPSSSSSSSTSAQATPPASSSEEDAYPAWKFLQMPYHPNNKAWWKRVLAVARAPLKNVDDVVNAFYHIHHDTKRDMRSVAHGLAHFFMVLATPGERERFFAETLPFIQMLLAEMPRLIADCCTWGNPNYLPLLRRRATPALSELSLSRIACAALNAGAFFALFSLPTTVGEKDSRRGNYNFFSFERILSTIGIRMQQTGKLRCILHYLWVMRQRVAAAVAQGDAKLQHTAGVTGQVSFYRFVPSAGGMDAQPSDPVLPWERVNPSTKNVSKSLSATPASLSALGIPVPVPVPVPLPAPASPPTSSSDPSTSTSTSTSSSSAQSTDAAPPSSTSGAETDDSKMTTTTPSTSSSLISSAVQAPIDAALQVLKAGGAVSAPVNTSQELIAEVAESKLPLVPVTIIEQGGMEEETVGQTFQIDFANQYLGGGVVRSGCVQEEIRFLLCPEMLVGLLFCESMGRAESILLVGAEQFSVYRGYAHSFEWAGPYTDPTPCDGRGRVATAFMAIDALAFGAYEQQFNIADCYREYVKAAAGFFFPCAPLVPDSIVQDDRARKQFTSSAGYNTITTGNWGCGAFRGDIPLKFVIQWLAASVAQRDIRYYTFSDRNAAGIADFVRVVQGLNPSVSDLFAATRGYVDDAFLRSGGGGGGVNGRFMRCADDGEGLKAGTGRDDAGNARGPMLPRQENEGVFDYVVRVLQAMRQG